MANKPDKIISNRIAELRKEQGYTLQQVGVAIGTRNATISRYENGDREPNLEKWQQLADFFKVPVDYLQGLSNDRGGWHLWEDRTGYSRTLIEFQIEQMKHSGRLADDDNLQEQIETACKYLDNHQITDQDAIMFIEYALNDLRLKAHDELYIDPIKKEKYSQEKKKVGESSDTITEKNYDGSLYRPNMNKEVYKKISDVLENARYELAEYLRTYDLK